MSRQAIMIGASSGIGLHVARCLAQAGYQVGLCARREELLRAAAAALPGKSFIKTLDVTRPQEARQALRELLAEMGDVELIILNSGIGVGPKTTYEQEERVIATNVTGFVALAEVAMEHFSSRGAGHLVGISSIAALKGFGRSAAYSASKAFISTYMQALRQKSTRLGMNIVVTDIKPGFVATPMTASREGMFWVAPVEKAAAQICRAISKRRSHAYITRRWRLMAWMLKLLPDALFRRLPM